MARFSYQSDSLKIHFSNSHVVIYLKTLYIIGQLTEEVEFCFTQCPSCFKGHFEAMSVETYKKYMDLTGH
jgi:hypothetical protein